jgi:phage virion morphogenesis protein
MARQEVEFAAFANGLNTLGGGIDFRPLVKIVRLQLVADTKRNFDGEHDPDGNPWKKLKRPRPKKGRAKKRGKAKDKILQDSGRLRASVASAFGGETVNEETPDGFAWGTNVPYGKFHQYGTRNHHPDGSTTERMVARVFLGVGPQLEKSIAELTEEWVANKVMEVVGSGHA